MRIFLLIVPCILILSVALLFAAPPAPAPEQSSAPTVPVVPNPYSVILISIDGLRPDAVTKHGPKEVPNFYRLREEGAFTDNARTAVDYTITLPNHTGMITSRLVSGSEGHGWTWNDDPPLGMNLHRNKGAYLESVFSVAHDHGLSTALFASKTKFSTFDLSYDEKNGQPDRIGEDNGRDKIDVYHMETRSESVVDDLERTMKKETFDFLMVHIRNPDTAGHGFTWTTSQPSIYMKAVKKADELLGDIFEKVESVPGWRGRTYLVVTADHGGLTGAKIHSQNEEHENFTVPFYVWGPGVPGGADLYSLNLQTRKDPGYPNPPADAPELPPIRNADAGNFCLSLLDLPPIPGSTVNTKQDLRAK
jgi:predicted AlkP superfamily pyrophosphatase or phosphodiesterase